MMPYLLLYIFNSHIAVFAIVQIWTKKKGIICCFSKLCLVFHSSGVVISLHKLLYELDEDSEPFHKSLYLVIAMG